MTPKEKALELISKYISNQNSWYLANLVDGLRIAQAKKCALVAVDLVISANPHSNPLNTTGFSTMGYWQEVKKEIEKL